MSLLIELFFAVSSSPLPWNSSEGRNLFIHYNYNSSTGELDTQVYINNFKVIWNFRQRYIEQTTPLKKNSLHSGTIEKTAKSWRQLQKISYLFTVVCILATHGDSGDSISSRNKILFLCYSYRHMWPFCSSLCRIHNRTCEIVRETPQSNSIKHLELNKWLR